MKEMIKINGMVCSGCEDKIKGKMAELTGVNRINIYFAENEAIVDFNKESISIEKIIEEIGKLGFGCELITNQNHQTENIINERKNSADGGQIKIKNDENIFKKAWNKSFRLKKKTAIILIMFFLIISVSIYLTTKNADYDPADTDGGSIAVQKNGYQEIRMDVTRNGWSPDVFVLKRGVPVKWIINGKELTGCNSGIQVPKYGLEFKIKQGEQIIEFTPSEEGTVTWSCWMGMIQGSFIVKADIGNKQQIKQEVDAAIAAAPASGGCGCGG